MPILDLTCPVPLTESQLDGPGQPPQTVETVTTMAWDLTKVGNQGTGMVYRFHHWSMSGTYLDLPGHLRETDDGSDAANYPLERLYRIETTVIKPAAVSAGGITADDLAAACQHPPTGGAIILNALGEKRHDQVAHRSVWLRRDAVDWIVGTGIHLFVSDVYESATEPQGVFAGLFGAGISTVCCPDYLHPLPAGRVRLTVLPLRIPTVTQLPCRIVAEWE